MTDFRHKLAGRRRDAARGFTLIELMVSIALALLLVVGINAVFKMSSDTVGTGMQVSELTRQFRAAQKVMDGDFQNMSPSTDGAALIIHGMNQPAFRDHKDELAAMAVKTSYAGPYDPNETTIDIAQAEILDVRDADGNSIFTDTSRTSTPTGGTALRPQTYLSEVLTNRNHRVDGLSMCVSNPQSFPRQTPNYGNNYTGQTMSSATAEYAGYYKAKDAWVTYGHVLQPDNTVDASNMLSFGGAAGGVTHFLGLGATVDPYTNTLYTAQTNPNNFYSGKWIVGRVATLLGDPAELDQFQNPYQGAVNTSDPQTFLLDPDNNSTNAYAKNLTKSALLRPLSWGSAINATQQLPNAGVQVQIQSSQCDVAGITLSHFRNKVINAQTNLHSTYYPPRWYMPLVAMGSDTPSAAGSQLPGAQPTPAGTWVWPSPGTPVTTTQLGYKPWHAFRQMAQAWPDKLGSGMAGGTNPLMHEQLAVQSPVFMRGCSQFIVEYAGDYLQQNTTSGVITGIGEDGEVDFDVIAPTNAPTGPDQNVKRIRWYGMTRSLDDGQTVEDTNRPIPLIAGGVGAPPVNSEMVRPLYRYIQSFTGAATVMPANMPFEKIVTRPLSPNPNYTGFPDAPPANVDSYTCAWGPLDMDLSQLPTAVPTAGDPSLIALWPKLIETGPSAPYRSRSLLPWMIRITVRLDDPAGRLPDGQTMQFIFNVPRPHF